MLKLKHHLFTGHTMASVPVALSDPASDDDELIQAIDNAADDHDDNWQLSPTPDTNKLESFWEHVVEDIHADPEWVPIGIDE